MFIKNSICNYNAQELLLVASKLAFAIDAWVTLILIMELTKLLFLAQKQNAIKEISTHVWICMITFPLIEPTIMIQFLIIFASLFHKNPPLNMDLPIILILLIFYNITFSLSHPYRINCKV